MSIAELEKKIYREAMEYGKRRMQEELKALDSEILEKRDRNKYKPKDFGTSVIKTLFGAVEYRRRRYLDKQGRTSCYLLDEELELNEFGKTSPMLAVTATKLATESTFRNASRQVEDVTGTSLSHQAVWNITQTVGERLQKKEKEKGKTETAILFEEADGIWINLQGQDRRDNGSGKEMKLAIAYDGTSVNGKRKECHNKVACAGFMETEEFRKLCTETIASEYKTETIKMRVLNGDGAAWIFNRKDQVITQLDVFHRNKAIIRNISEPEIRKKVFKSLYSKKTDEAIDIVETYLNSIAGDEKESEKVKELLKYLNSNKNRLIEYKRRGIELPETNQNLEYSRLGAMESNVFTLIGNRMKGRRKCWTIKGANNMATILCLKHTGRLEQALKRINLPVIEKESEDCYSDPLSAEKVLPSVGKGYNGYHSCHISDQILRKQFDPQMLS